MKKHLLLAGVLLLAVLFSSCTVETVHNWTEDAKKEFAASLFDASMTVFRENMDAVEDKTVVLSKPRMFFVEESNMEKESVLLKEAVIKYEIIRTSGDADARLTIHSTGVMTGYTMDFALDIEFFSTSDYQINELSIDGQDVDRTWFKEYAVFNDLGEGVV